MSKAITPVASGLLMERRDELKQIALEMKLEADKVEDAGHLALRTAKDKAHEMRIKANQLLKKAEIIQSCISQENEAFVNESKVMLEAYSIKSPVHAALDAKLDE